MGLTLLELIVVVVVLGILSAIAIPTFLSIIGESKYAALETTAHGLAEDAAGLAALTGKASWQTSGGTTYVQQAAGDLSGVAVTKVSVAQYTLTRNTTSVCLTVATAEGGPPNVKDGSCALYNYDAFMASLHPTVWWKLATAPGTGTALDSSGNNHTAPVRGGLAFGVAGPLESTPLETAASFSNTARLLTSFAAPAATAYSVVLWYRTPVDYTPSGSTAGIIRAGTPTGTHVGFRVDAGGGSVNFVASNGTTSAQVSAPGHWDDQWHQLAFVCSGSQLQSYEDGALVGSTALNSCAGPTTFQVSYPSYWRGSLAQVAFVKKALAASQVDQLYNDAL